MCYFICLKFRLHEGGGRGVSAVCIFRVFFDTDETTGHRHFWAPCSLFFMALCWPPFVGLETVPARGVFLFPISFCNRRREIQKKKFQKLCLHKGMAPRRLAGPCCGRSRAYIQENGAPAGCLLSFFSLPSFFFFVDHDDHGRADQPEAKGNRTRTRLKRCQLKTANGAQAIGEPE